jgi:AraC-like DNA-binding protein
LLYDLKKFDKRDLWHFAPVVFYIAISFEFYFLNASEKVEWIANRTLFYQIVDVIADEFAAVQGITYSILILFRLDDYKKEVANYESNIDQKILRALFKGVILIALAWVIAAIDINLDYFGLISGNDLLIYTFLLIVLAIYYTSYVAIYSPEIFKVEATKLRVVFLRRKKTDVIIKSDNDKNKPQLETFDQALTTIMENDKPYLKFNLNLAELAEMVNLTRNQLSFVINQKHRMNFNEYINSYRVEEVKRLMVDPANQHLKLMSLAYDAGFNSKASFNRIFKKLTDMTPSQFFTMEKAE